MSCRQAFYLLHCLIHFTNLSDVENHTSEPESTAGAPWCTLMCPCGWRCQEWGPCPAGSARSSGQQTNQLPWQRHALHDDTSSCVSRCPFSLFLSLSATFWRVPRSPSPTTMNGDCKNKVWVSEMMLRPRQRPQITRPGLEPSLVCVQAAQPWTPRFLLGASVSSPAEWGYKQSSVAQTAVGMERRNGGQVLGTSQAHANPSIRASIWQSCS